MERSTILKFGKPSISMGHLYHGKLLVITRGYCILYIQESHGCFTMKQKRGSCRFSITSTGIGYPSLTHDKTPMKLRTYTGTSHEITSLIVFVFGHGCHFRSEVGPAMMVWCLGHHQMGMGQTLVLQQWARFYRHL